MSKVAVGLRVHSGWAVLVALELKKIEPVVFLRQRLQLVEIFDYQFRQPYHTAEKMPPQKGREFISQIRKVARTLAYRGLRSVQVELAKEGRRLTACGMLLSSGRPLPSLEKILASHALIHTADGELFREALAHASTRCGLRVFCMREKGLVALAAQSLGLAEPGLSKGLKELGGTLGAPWSQDEKYAALAAWLVLSGGKGSVQRIQTRKRE